jgi:uncharacterized membrane-anchored protein YitT (DUF2179 family)
MKNNSKIVTSIEEFKENLNISDVSTRYLILSGEGGYETQHQFVMELDSLKEANTQFSALKSSVYKDTYLYIYEAKKIREE